MLLVLPTALVLVLLVLRSLLHLLLGGCCHYGIIRVDRPFAQQRPQSCCISSLAGKRCISASSCPPLDGALVEGCSSHCRDERLEGV
jgi:hypothetical protein